MHRPSAQSDPFAPLGYHWQDATHTFGGITAGVFTRSVQLEGTLFQSREPDDDRYDFDFGALDSYGGRLTVIFRTSSRRGKSFPGSCRRNSYRR